MVPPYCGTPKLPMALSWTPFKLSGDVTVKLFCSTTNPPKTGAAKCTNTNIDIKPNVAILTTSTLSLILKSSTTNPPTLFTTNPSFLPSFLEFLQPKPQQQPRTPKPRKPSNPLLQSRIFFELHSSQIGRNSPTTKNSGDVCLGRRGRESLQLPLLRRRNPGRRLMSRRSLGSVLRKWICAQ